MIDGVPLGWIISFAVLFAIVYWRIFSFKGGSDTPKPSTVKIDDKTEAKIWGTIAIVIGAFFIYIFFFA